MFTSKDVKTGAAHNRRHARKNPTEVMVRLLEEDPHAPKEKIIERWWKVVRDDDDYEEAIRDYAGTNAWDAIHRKSRPRSAPPPSIQERAKRAAEAQQIAGNHVLKVLEGEISLDFVMPDGRKFGDWKGGDVANLGGRFIRIGKKVGNKSVRDVLKTDKQLQAVK